MVSLEDIKSYLKIQHIQEDDLLERLIAAATKEALDYLCRTYENKDGEFDSDLVPEPVKLWVMRRVGRLYEQREAGATSEAVPGFRTVTYEDTVESLVYYRKEPGL